MYVLFSLFIVLQFHKFASEYVKCSNCKYVIREKYKIIHKNIEHIPQKCKLFYRFTCDNNGIKKDHLETKICRNHSFYCGKNGTFYIE